MRQQTLQEHRTWWHSLPTNDIAPGAEHDIAEQLDDLIQEHGAEHLGPWLVMATAFHGGGVASRHTSAIAAVRSLRHERWADRGCTCGAAHIIPASQYDQLPDHNTAHNPYAAAKA